LESPPEAALRAHFAGLSCPDNHLRRSRFAETAEMAEFVEMAE
jgi:hypothetical protein